MVEITHAPIAKEKIELKRDTAILQPLEAFMGKRGTEYIQIVEDNIFELLKIGIDKFGDGFQLTDLTAIVSLYSPIKGISENLEGAKLDFADLDAEETGANLEYIVDNILMAFNVDLSNNGTIGIDNLQLAIDKLFEAVKIVKSALSDGADLEDIKKAPALFQVLIDFALVISDAVEEAQDLSGSELGDISREFASNLHYLIKS